MGICDSKLDYLDDLQKIDIPEKEHLSDDYMSQNIIFVKNDIMTAYKAIIKSTGTEVVIKKMIKTAISQKLIL